MTRLQRKPSNGLAVMDTEDRAEAYLRRVVGLTGARQLGRYYYLLDVGKTRFEVHDSYVSRTPNATVAAGTRGGTCFYLPNQHVPAAEKIASALLQLRENPGLFDRWASQRGPFKADGESFGQVNHIPRRATFS